MAELEEWTQAADPDHPLRQAFLAARLFLECERSGARDFSMRTMRKVFRERRALLKTSESLLLEYSTSLLDELASAIRVDLPPDEREAQGIILAALRRTSARWGRATERIERAMRAPRGRPASIAIGSLAILCEEIQRSPLAGARMKGGVHRLVATWAAKATGGRPATLLRELQMQRRKSLRGR